MTEEISKTERERQLDEKIKAMKALNALALQRKKEVDKDKQLAEINRSSVTSVARPARYENEPFSPPERPKAKLRPRPEEYAAPEPAGRKDPPPKRGGGRLADAEGPPPDPGYRFLADRMREDEEEESRKPKTGKVPRPGNSARGRDRVLGSGRRHMEEEEDEIIIVLEKDRHGRIQNHSSPLTGRGGGEDRRTVLRSSDKKPPAVNSYVNMSKPTRIKSLFDDDDDFDDYPVKERWADSEPKGLSSPRKIEEQGGKLTITRTLDNMRPAREPDTRRDQAHIMPTETRRDQGLTTPKREPLSRAQASEVVNESEAAWQCSDPSCRSVNPSGTSACQRCRLAYTKSQQYKSTHACDKYKQEFNARKPKSAGPQPTQSHPSSTHQSHPSSAHQSHPSSTHHSHPSTAHQYANGAEPHGPAYYPENGLVEWKTELEMLQYGGPDWTVGVAQWPQMSPDLILGGPPYGLMVNQVANYPPPMAGYYEPRQYYSHQEFLGASPFPASTQPTFPSATQSNFPASAQFTFQPNSSHFNPAAQSFVPSSDPPSLFQTPPPVINPNLHMTAQTVRPPPPPFSNGGAGKPVDPPNLMLSLKSPPKPLAFNRSQESRKPFQSDRTFRSSEESSVSSRLSDKNTQNSRLAPRFSRSKDLKQPPSMVEMQSGSLKRDHVPPPPSHKGTGLLVFGTSNVVNHLDDEKMGRDLGLSIRMVPAMKLESFKEKLSEIEPARDWLILIHGLGNDARNIALRRTSDGEKAKEADDVANTFCDIIETKILPLSPHLYTFVSMLLPRCDFQERYGMSNPNNVRKVMNVQITSRLYQNPRVGLINSDQVLRWEKSEARQRELMQSDGYHLTQLGFDLMVENWTSTLLHHLDKTRSTHTPANPLLCDEPSEGVDPSGDAEPGDPKEQGGNEEPGGPGETVPDPFGAYTAPEDVLAPKCRADGETVELGSDTEDWDTIPNLETVEQPTPEPSSTVSGTSSQLEPSFTIVGPISQPETSSTLCGTTSQPQPFSTLGDTTSQPQSSSTLCGTTSQPQSSSTLGGTTSQPQSSSTLGDTIDQPLPSFALGGAARIPNCASSHEGGEFIEDDYCGEEGRESIGPLPSLNLFSSGPESSDFGPVSGFYMEDSYLPASLEALSVTEESAGLSTHIDVLCTHTDVLSSHTDVLSTHKDVLSTHTDVLSTHTDVLSQHTDVLSTHTDVLSRHTDVLSIHTDGLSIHTDGLSNHPTTSQTESGLLETLVVSEIILSKTCFMETMPAKAELT